jgi:hypothetical protein
VCIGAAASSSCSTSTEKLADGACEAWPTPALPRKNLFDGHEHGAQMAVPSTCCPCARTRCAPPHRVVGCNNGDAESASQETAISVRLVVNALAHRAQAAPLCSVHRIGSFAAGAGRRKLGGNIEMSGVPPTRVGPAPPPSGSGAALAALPPVLCDQPLVQLGEHVGRHRVEETVEADAVQEAPPLLTPRADESIHRQRRDLALQPDVLAFEPARCGFQFFEPRQLARDLAGAFRPDVLM